MLFVCTGNICRSAYAEHVLQGLLDQRAHGRVDVASVGTQPNQALHVPDPLVRIADGAGFPGLERHRPTPVQARILEESELILTATEDHMRRVLRESPRAIRRTFTMLEFAELVRQMDARTDEPWFALGEGIPGLASAASRQRTLARSTGRSLDVADPFGGPVEGYQAMAELLAPVLDATADTVARAVTPVSGSAAGPSPDPR